jgi:hypothetical protein
MVPDLLRTIATCSISCKKYNVEIKEPEPVVMAQVFQYKLTFDDIRDLIQDYSNEKIASSKFRSLTDHWVRDRLLLVEAEKNFPKEVNMNKLLRGLQAITRYAFL